MNRIRALLSHILIIISGIFLCCLVLDSYNPTMDFTGNTVSVKLLWVFCSLTILNSLLTIAEKHRSLENKTDQ